MSVDRKYILNKQTSEFNCTVSEDDFSGGMLWEKISGQVWKNFPFGILWEVPPQWQLLGRRRSNPGRKGLFCGLCVRSPLKDAPGSGGGIWFEPTHCPTSLLWSTASHFICKSLFTCKQSILHHTYLESDRSQITNKLKNNGIKII